MLSVNGNPIQVNTQFVSDVADWYNLKEIKIGDQIWSDKNFDYNPINFTPGIYSRSAVNGYDLGKQYYYPPISLNTELSNNVPEWKWRVPTSADFKTLIDYCGGENIAGKILKSTYAWNSGGNGIDTYGFNALPVGSAGTDTTTNYSKAGITTVFATTTSAYRYDYWQSRNVIAYWVVGLSSVNDSMHGWWANTTSNYNPNIYVSVRLIKDA